jgi:hypothetical protein
MSIQGICYIEINSGYYSQPQVYGQEVPLILVDTGILDESVPEPTESVPEETTESVPEPTAESVPEETTESVPEPTAESVPEPTAESVPDETTESVPDETTQGFQGFSSNIGSPIVNESKVVNVNKEEFKLEDLEKNHYIIIFVILMIIVLIILLTQKLKK